jgi:hypothetical protein
MFSNGAGSLLTRLQPLAAPATKDFFNLLLVRQSLNRQMSALEQTADNAVAIAARNAALVDIQLNRELEQIGYEARTLAASQRVSAAGRGIALTSKSALMVQNEMLNRALSMVVDKRLNAKHEKEAITYEGQVRAAQAINQVSTLQSQKTQATGQFLGSLTKAIGSVF